MAGVHTGWHDCGSDGGALGAARGNGLGMAKCVFIGRRTHSSAARWSERAVPRAIVCGGRSRGRICARVLVGTSLPGFRARGRAWWSVLLSSMGLVLLCANGLHFLIAWE